MENKSQHNARELDLHHLQIFDVLLKERSLTKAAAVLDLTQPALSKILARLRIYFDDPLFVRVAQRMEPTPKALALAEPIVTILAGMRDLRADRTAFDPKTSRRRFSFYMIDAASVLLLPSLLAYLRAEAPNVHVQAVQCDVRHLDLWLESGVVDFAVGSFPSLMHGIRRQLLWNETYAAVVRKAHPRLGPNPSVEAFVNEQHALVTTTGTGHEHVSAERLLEAAIPAENFVCRIPMFAAAAHIAKHSDTVVTLPRTLAEAFAADLDLQLVTPPIDLPRMEIGQYWHDRYHREPGNQWIRSVFRTLYLR
jgi:DNA-binding transcriptional LysR family regulator